MFIGATEPLKSLAISRKQYLIITATYKTPYDNSVIPYGSRVQAFELLVVQGRGLL